MLLMHLVPALARRNRRLAHAIVQLEHTVFIGVMSYYLNPEDCERRVGSILWIVRGRTPSPTTAYDQED
ncbi:hypothetical protein SK128_002677 [Halocaridina rubra]|uniref:Uncharacterized protein n=1 Tax=Halocaridina rubra TaxID=373956 RepID=A0AAN8WLL4_HALRR